MAASTLMIEANMKAVLIIFSNSDTLVLNNSTLPLKHVPCIYYLVYFKKNEAKIQTLFDFDSEINAMT